MATSMQETFGERLKRLREIAGLNLSDFASRLRVNPATISLYESGKRSPNLRFLKRLRRQFGVSIDGFIDGLPEDKGEGN